MNIVNQIIQRFPAPAQNVTKLVMEVGTKLNKQVLVVGGVVRDFLLNKPIHDVDFLSEHPVSELVSQVARKLNGKVVSHERFLTFTIHLGSGDRFDFVTAREEIYEAPAQLPKIKPAPIGNDFKRRDFTINAIGVSLTDQSQSVFDPFGGQADLEKKTIRELHPKSFVDDPTRIYRAARYAGRFGFSLAPQTEALVKEAIQNRCPALLSPARRRNELLLILKESHPIPALELLENWSALTFFQPHWKIEPAHRALLTGPQPDENNRLVAQRLSSWLKPWGRKQADQFLNDYVFEKWLKKQVLEIL